MSSAAALGLRKTPAGACETGKSAPAAVAAPLKIGTLDSWRMGNANRPKATAETGNGQRPNGTKGGTRTAKGNGGNGQPATGDDQKTGNLRRLPRLTGSLSLKGWDVTALRAERWEPGDTFAACGRR